LEEYNWKHYSTIKCDIENSVSAFMHVFPV
jgi:hypothetical protein